MREMKLIIFLFSVIGINQLALAQYGMSLQFSSANFTSTEITDISNSEIITPATGYQVGLNYWLRLKNVRVEFFPELAFSEHNARPLEQLPDFTMKRWSIILPASFYLLDFKGDCHCPTFSKQNDTVKKGLFLQILSTLEQEKALFEGAPDSRWHQNIGAGLGTGLDIGISDFLTVTPLVQYISTLYTSKDDLQPGTKSGWRAGIRVLFRPDYR